MFLEKALILPPLSYSKINWAVKSYLADSLEEHSLNFKEEIKQRENPPLSFLRNHGNSHTLKEKLWRTMKGNDIKKLKVYMR